MRPCYVICMRLPVLVCSSVRTCIFKCVCVSEHVCACRSLHDSVCLWSTPGRMSVLVADGILPVGHLANITLFIYI